MRTFTKPFLLATLLALAAGQSIACSCNRNDKPGGFLHLSKDGRIALPANALGVLFTHEVDLKWTGRDQIGNYFLSEVPPPLSADDFVIRNQTTKRALPAVLTSLNIDAQLDHGAKSYFLLTKQLSTAENLYGEDLGANARKLGMKDVSASVRAATGLFRVAPKGGFVAGHRYIIMVRKKMLPIGFNSMATADIGPPLAVSSSDPFTLVAQGAPTRELLSRPAGSMCDAKVAAVVQRLAYAIPQQRAGYRHLLMAFLGQRFFGTDLRDEEKDTTFIATQYYSSMCAEPIPYGMSALGQGKDLVFAQCPTIGASLQRRLVRGHAGMLELEDALHDTPVLEVPFEQASGPYCWVLRLTGH